MEIKVCPYCGGEINQSANKCKHCGKWLEKQCPQCGEWVNAEAKKCRFCGYWFDAWQRRLQEKAEEEKAKQNETVASAVAEAVADTEDDDDDFGCFYYAENIIVIVLVGIALDLSWWGYLLTAIILFGLLQIHILRFLYCLGISVVWGLVGVGLAPYLLDESEAEMGARILTDNFSDYWWIGGIAFVISIVMHGKAMFTSSN